MTRNSDFLTFPEMGSKIFFAMTRVFRNKSKSHRDETKMKRNTGIIRLIAAVLVVFAVAPAIVIAEPQTSFVVGGYVSDADDSPCNGSWVRITNDETGVSWNARNASESNYYQLVITSDDVSEGDLLRFVVVCGDESAETECTVTLDDINRGGFGLDIPIGDLPGDVNGDGEVTPADVVIVLKMAVCGEFSEAADVSGDGQVTSLDALMILQWS